MSNSLESKYKDIIRKAYFSSTIRNDRTGVGCKSIFKENLSWTLIKGKFPLMTGRKIYQKVFKTEFKWFINGETNIKRFQDAGVKIWDSWANDKGDLGPVYGHQMLSYNSSGLNQLDILIEGLKSDPDSRRHIISLWNPLQIKEMALPPCYHYFQFFVEDGNKLNMFVLQRSGDLLLGIPYDIALFSQILLYVAEKTNLMANIVDLDIIDAHIYLNQIEAVDKYLATKTFELPDFKYKDGELNITNYKFDKLITASVAV
tara:strand:- start:60 stop:836 length:777 start_codon:yes stop_codon:yes gene_type:complete